jgi:hypothetical protein
MQTLIGLILLAAGAVAARLTYRITRPNRFPRDSEGHPKFFRQP